MGFSLFKNKKEQSVVLDLDVESIRVLVVEKGAGQNTIVNFYEQESKAWDNLKQGSLDFDVLKKDLTAVLKKLGLLKKLNKQEVIIGLPAEVLKAAVVKVSLEREDETAKISKQEEAKIREALRHKAGQLLFEIIQKELGLEPHNFQILRHYILESKVSGYKVMSLFGMRGKQMEFKVLLVFALSSALNLAPKLVKDFALKNYSLRHPAEGLVGLLQKQKLLNSKILVDLRQNLTTIFLCNQILETISEFKVGSNHFIKSLKQNCKLTNSETKSLVELLAENKLSPGVKLKVEKALWPAFSLWQSNFVQYLKKKRKDLTFAPCQICFFKTSNILKELKTSIEKNQVSDNQLNAGFKFNDLELSEFPVKIKQGLHLPETALSMVILTFS